MEPAEPAVEADQASDTRSISDDSGYADTECTTESLRSSVYAYEEEHGRTYHAFHAGKYVVPNDEGEQERMDLHYHSMRLSIQDKLFHAPLDAPTAILDVGTGTGIWAMDAADEFPAADVIGFDLSPIQPSFVSPNVHFEVLDAEESWNYGENRFSLVHTRYMNGFGLKSWPHFYEEAFACLKPGGWVENQEFDAVIVSDDNTIPENSVIQRWCTLWNEGAEKIGLTGRCYPNIQVEQMKQAGFVDIKVIPFKMPIGPWPKEKQLREAGSYGLVGLTHGIDGLSLKIFTHCLDWSILELEIFLAHAKAELRRKSIHSYWPIYVIMGRKPEADIF